MCDGFNNPDSLFEEFEKEPTSQFNSSVTNGKSDNDDYWDNDKDCVGDEGPLARTTPTDNGLLFKTPKELLVEAPGIQLTFLNHPKFIKYRSAIEHFFAQLLSQDDDVDDKGDGISSLPKPLPTALYVGPSGSRRAFDDESVWKTTGCLQLYPEFYLDAHGQPLVQLTHELTLGWDVPPFERLFEKHIPQEEEGLVPKGTRRGRVCFNCGEESHAIADCPLPKNMKEIQRRKAEIRKQNNVPTLSGNKATLDVTVDPRFKFFKPGAISDELRSAIGCDERKLPPWIYRMRLLGYPPGWLDEAILTHSGLTMHEGDGGRLRSDGLHFESGEVEDLNFEEAKEFQLAKLVEYPGFNAPPPEGISDESRRYQVPPFNRNQSLDFMRSEFARRNEDLKRRLGLSTDESSGDDGEPEKKRRRTMEKNNGEEMDLSSGEEPQFRPPLPPGTPPPPTPPAPLPSSTPPSTPGSCFTPPSSRHVRGRRLPTYASDASSNDDPRSSCSSQSDGEVIDDSEGIVVEDDLEEGEMEDGEMPPTPPPPSASETKQIEEISTGRVAAGIAPPSSPPPNDSDNQPTAPSTPANPTSILFPSTPSNAATASIATPSTPAGLSLNSISMEHSTPIPSRFDISDFLDDDDDVGDEDASLDVADADATTPSSSKRYPVFHESDPSVNPTMPTPDQWAKNVSEHMDFLNLPNTEGRFSKIKEIVNRRKKLVKEKKTK